MSVRTSVYSFVCPSIIIYFSHFNKQTNKQANNQKMLVSFIKMYMYMNFFLYVQAFLFYLFIDTLFSCWSLYGGVRKLSKINGI